MWPHFPTARVTTETPIQATASYNKAPLLHYFLPGVLPYASALTSPCQPRESAQHVYPLASFYLAFHSPKGPLPVIHTLPREATVIHLQNPLSVYIGPAGYFLLGSLSCWYVPTSNYSTMALCPVNTFYGPGVPGGISHASSIPSQPP